MNSVTPGIPARLLFHAQERQAVGVAGGGFTSGAWRTRALNTVLVNAIPGAGLASSQVTLPAGDYEFSAWAIGYETDTHQARLYDVTGAAALGLGASIRAWTAHFISPASMVSGAFTLAAVSLVELQHWATFSQPADGFGYPASVGPEVYSELMVWKV